MSFATDINTLLNSDATTNGLVTGIYFMNSPDNQDLTSEYIVFNYELTDSINEIQKYNLLDIYQLNIICFSDSTKTLDELTEAVISAFNNYEDTNFRDFQLVSDNRNMELDKEQYNNDLEFKIIYEK